MTMPILLLSVLAALALQEPGQVPPASEGPAIAPPSPGLPPSVERTVEPRVRVPATPAPVSVSGRVLLDGVQSPAASVLVQALCDGRVVRETYAGGKGRFSLQLPAVRRGGTGSRFEAAGLEGCELRVSSPGYEAGTVDLSGRRVMDNPEVGAISLRHTGEAKGTLVSITSLRAPKGARKAYQKALRDIEKRQWAQARKNLEKSLQAYPEYAAAWCELGVAHQQEGRTDEARQAWSRAVALDANFVRPHLKLAEAALGAKRWQELADATGHIVRLDRAGFPEAHLYNALAHFSLGSFDAAERSARQAIRLDTAHRLPKAEHLLGVILANKNDYAGAAEHMRAYLTRVPNAPDAEYVRKQIAQLERSAGR